MSAPAKKMRKQKSARLKSKKAAVRYDDFKEFERRRYTGMKVGRRHKWYYEHGEWKEQKVTPDKWQFTYAVTKRRAGRAPEGSGVPVGTEYHWYILADQTVTKLNANDYATSMSGLKFKLAHKRAASDKWSSSEQAQRNRLIKLLRETIHELQSQNWKERAEPAARISGRKSA